MKTLTAYRKNRYEFNLFHREGNLAIFKGKSVDSGVENFEVIEIQSHNGFTMGGVYMEPAEFAPSNEQWGNKGWTALNEEDAWRIFNKRK